MQTDMFAQTLFAGFVEVVRNGDGIDFRGRLGV